MFVDWNGEDWMRIVPKYVVEEVPAIDGSTEYRICRLNDKKYSRESWGSAIQAQNARLLGEYSFD
ncbi:hypothetical protein F4V43_01895 [Paenibacillus spiritus]|uniref:Uncharacterized protein n=1 Tax=Paenibacillus spiritus TaxID=2496557 RepID=A0A5J5GHR0_9BACL|nr:hypothetical protein [Paenibacillus spiritus]KAA9007263.1 hypothetical protein F4V43_01895 [Paenibacillus spiritus]